MANDRWIDSGSEKTIIKIWVKYLLFVQNVAIIFLNILAIKESTALESVLQKLCLVKDRLLIIKVFTELLNSLKKLKEKWQMRREVFGSVQVTRKVFLKRLVRLSWVIKFLKKLNSASRTILLLEGTKKITSGRVIKLVISLSMIGSKDGWVKRWSVAHVHQLRMFNGLILAVNIGEM
jgi:hypothetical protein